MSFEWLISFRYLKAKRKQAFISLISLISMAGVGLGVCALIVVLSVMNGFQKDWRDKILGVTAHLLVQSHQGALGGYGDLRNRVEEVAGVEAATPFIYSQAMISYQGRVSGVILRGIQPETAVKVTALKESLLGHNPEVFNKKLVDSGGEGGGRLLEPIVIGRELADNLGLGIGATVRLISPYGRVTPAGRMAESRYFVVADLFHSGMYEYDAGLALLPLAAAQSFLSLGDKVTGVEVRLKDIYRAKEVGSAIKKSLGRTYWIRDWMELNRNLFAALKLEKTAMFVILVLIVLVAAFNIISTLIMIVMEKTKDIAILKSIGATSGSIRKIFLYQGLTIGTIGTGFGLGLGLILCELLRRYKFIELPSDVYYITTMPVRVEPLDVALIVLASLGISLLATLYPSRQAARLDPTEGLRYE